MIFIKSSHSQELEKNSKKLLISCLEKERHQTDLTKLTKRLELLLGTKRFRIPEVTHHQ